MLDAGNHAEARDALAAARSEAIAMKTPSGHIEWLLAIACDTLEDLEAAAFHIREAIAIDPGSPPYRRSLDIIQGRLHAALHAINEGKQPRDLLKLYEALKSLGPVDSATHLVIARYLYVSGRRAAALELARAIALVSDDEHAAAFAAELEAETVGRSESVLTGELSSPSEA